jgi:hypothetical protein
MMNRGFCILATTLLLIVLGSTEIEARRVTDDYLLTSLKKQDERCFFYDANQAKQLSDPRTHHLYTYQVPVLIRDERAAPGKGDHWVYSDACVNFDPNGTLELDRQREKNDAWTNITFMERPGRTWQYDPNATGMYEQNDRRSSGHLNPDTITIDHFPGNAGSEIWMPAAYDPTNADAFIRVRRPIGIPVGITHMPNASPLLALLKEANFSVSIHQQDDRTNSPVTRAWMGYMHDRIKADGKTTDGLPIPAVLGWKHVGQILHNPDLNVAHAEAHLMQAMVWRRPAYTTTQAGSRGTIVGWYLFPSLTLRNLKQEACETGKVIVTGVIQNDSPSVEKWRVEYSWNGTDWHIGMEQQLRAYQNRPGDLSAPTQSFRLQLTSPTAQSQLKVRIRPQADSRLDRAWDRAYGQEQAALLVKPCACDLQISGLSAPSDVGQSGFSATVTVQKVGCAVSDTVMVSLEMGGRRIGLKAITAGRGLTNATFSVVPPSCGQAVPLTASVDPFGSLAETNEANNERTVQVSVSCGHVDQDGGSCDPDTPPEECYGSSLELR